jgi:hypothetical protein
LKFFSNIFYRFINFTRKLNFFLTEKSSELFDRFLLSTGVEDHALSSLATTDTIVFSGLSLNHRVTKNLKYLKRYGKYNLLLLKHRSDAFNDFDRSFFHSEIIYRNKFHLKRLLFHSDKLKLIYAYASKPSYAKAAIEAASCKTIFDPYDCWIVYYGKNPEQSWMKKEIVEEEYCFSNASGILARNLEAKKSMEIFGLKKKKKYSLQRLLR